MAVGLDWEMSHLLSNCALQRLSFPYFEIEVEMQKL